MDSREQKTLNNWLAPETACIFTAFGVIIVISSLEPIVGISRKVGPLGPPFLQATHKMQAVCRSGILAETGVLTVRTSSSSATE